MVTHTQKRVQVTHVRSSE